MYAILSICLKIFSKKMPKNFHLFSIMVVFIILFKYRKEGKIGLVSFLFDKKSQYQIVFQS